jgi:hypothetical protein
LQTITCPEEDKDFASKYINILFFTKTFDFGEKILS